jgi:hypothetical protein
MNITELLLMAAREHGHITRYTILHPDAEHDLFRVQVEHGEGGHKTVVGCTSTHKEAFKLKRIVRERGRVVNNTLLLDATHRSFREPSKAQALVDEGLADDLADARAQLEDMGE